MKFIFALFAVNFLFFSLHAQEKNQNLFVKDEITNEYYFEQVMPAEGLKKTVMFERAKNWVTANLKTSDNNISADEQSGTIVNSAAIKIDRKMFVGLEIHEGYYDFKLNLSFKDDKYKIRVDNIMYYLIIEQSGGFAEKGMKPRTYTYGDLEDNKMGRYLKKQVSEKTLSLLEILNKVIVEAKEEKKSDNW